MEASEVGVPFAAWGCSAYTREHPFCRTKSVPQCPAGGVRAVIMVMKTTFQLDRPATIHVNQRQLITPGMEMAFHFV